MLFFPTPYPDEMLYSVIARWHTRSGNLSYKATTTEVFSNPSKSATALLPSGISSLVSNLPPFSTWNETKIINDLTLFPYLTAFLEPQQAEKIYRSMCNSDNKDPYMYAGIAPSSIKFSNYFRFCPKCYRDDEEECGEPYWHRIHHIPGISYCLKHFCLLINSLVPIGHGNKQSFQCPTELNCLKQWDKSITFIYEKMSNSSTQIVSTVTEDILWLLKSSATAKPMNFFRIHYLQKMNALSLATKTRVRQREWREYIQDCSGTDVLSLYQSEIDSGWVSEIVRKNRKSFSPIRHLLVASALGISVKQLFSDPISKAPLPKWLCLNPVCHHYLQPVHPPELKGSAGENGVGVLCCPFCQYTYSRLLTENNPCKKRRVISFGPVWEKELVKLVSRNLSTREVARRLSADSRTINNYIRRARNNKKDTTPTISGENQNKDRREWLRLQKLHPSLTKTELRKIQSALFLRLYRNDRDWMDSNSPIKRKPVSSMERIQWNTRDQAILQEVKKTTEKMRNKKGRPERITIGSIERNIGKRDWILRYKDKLPCTYKYLKLHVETIEEFQKRRINWAVNHLEETKGKAEMWEVFRLAGIKQTEEWTFYFSNLGEDSSIQLGT